MCKMLENYIENNNKVAIITTDENIISQIRHDLINESMEVFIENMKAINVKKEELIEIIKDKY